MKNEETVTRTRRKSVTWDVLETIGGPGVGMSGSYRYGVTKAVTYRHPGVVKAAMELQ
jgi:hypothetical protein